MAKRRIQAIASSLDKRLKAIRVGMEISNKDSKIMGRIKTFKRLCLFVISIKVPETNEPARKAVMYNKKTTPLKNSSLEKS